MSDTSSLRIASDGGRKRTALIESGGGPWLMPHGPKHERRWSNLNLERTNSYRVKNKRKIRRFLAVTFAAIVASRNKPNLILFTHLFPYFFQIYLLRSILMTMKHSPQEQTTASTYTGRRFIYLDTLWVWSTPAIRSPLCTPGIKVICRTTSWAGMILNRYRPCLVSALSESPITLKKS